MWSFIFYFTSTFVADRISPFLGPDLARSLGKLGESLLESHRMPLSCDNGAFAPVRKLRYALKQ